jgi:3-methylcrotonyl-CoA carboxylase alpha subunit
LVPGYHGADQSPALLRAEAARIGFPLLIKASAGGGGKGMRIVNGPAEFEEALALAKGEARASFGDDQVLIERYLTRPRHIEVQFFADTQGNTIHLFERDCSIQRRHQKVVEEAPAPGMTEQRRAAMGEAACAAARAIGYVGAGTVEFIVEGDSFFFMEMNTRLQVEHPVTEAITGQDLVEWQLRVAAGQLLPLRQDQLHIQGHAIEVRVYAEDPARDFAPSIGVLHHLRAPEGEGVRVDTGVRQGDAIPIHYDPMIAKLIVHGADRAAAVARLRQALAQYEIAGVATNLSLLRAIAASPDFAAAALDTGFIARHPDVMAGPPAAPRPVLAAAVHRLLQDEVPPASPSDPYSPWALAQAWRLNGDGYQDFLLREGEVEHRLRAHLSRESGFRLDFADGAAQVSARRTDEGDVLLRLDDASVRLRVLRRGDALTVFLDGVGYGLRQIDPRAPKGEDQAAGGRVLAPMPGRVLELLVTVGERVTRGQVLLVLEAMKVQMRILAPAEGVVAALRCHPGELVEDGVELILLERISPES